MSELSWLENLQKAEPLPRLEPSASIDLFSDLFRVDHDVTAAKTEKVFDDGAVDILSAPEELLKTIENRKFHLPESDASDALEKRAKPRRKVVYGDAKDTRIVVKTDITNYPHSRLISEFGEDGRIFRMIEETHPDHIEKLFSIDEPSLEDYVSEDIGKLLGLSDLEDALQK